MQGTQSVPRGPQGADRDWRWHDGGMLTPERLVGLLAEPERLRVVAALALGARTSDEIVEAAGLELRKVVNALDRLEAAGLVEPAGDGWLLLEAAFKRAARLASPEARPSDHPDEPDGRRRILDRAFVDGRLTRLPAKRAKRLVVLDHLAQRFEPGRRYSEKQVNASLSQVDADTATLRRWLVDEGFLDRADGEYWRCGGQVVR